MSLRNKLAILSFTLMSLMTIPTFAENDTPSVTSRIEDAIHTVEIKTPAGWQETKAYSEIPESFEFNGLVFHGLKFKNGTERHGCAIFFATDLDEDDDEITEEALVQAQAQVQRMAFPNMEIARVTFTKFKITGTLEGEFPKDYAKVNISGSLEGNLSNASGNQSTVTVSGKAEGDSTNNFAVGIGRIALEGTQSYCGVTGVLLADDYQLIIVAWGAEEGDLEKDLNLFKDSIAITTKIPTKKPVVEPVVKEEAPSEFVTTLSEEPKKAETPAAVTEESRVATPDEPVARLEEPKQAETSAAVTEESRVATPAEPIARLEEPKQAETPAAVTEESRVLTSAEPVARFEESKQAETSVAVTEEAGQASVLAPPVAVIEKAKEANIPVEVAQAVVNPDQPGVIEKAKEADIPVEVAQAVVETAQVHPNV